MLLGGCVDAIELGEAGVLVGLVAVLVVMVVMDAAVVVAAVVAAVVDVLVVVVVTVVQVVLHVAMYLSQRLGRHGDATLWLNQNSFCRKSASTCAYHLCSFDRSARATFHTIVCVSSSRVGGRRSRLSPMSLRRL